MSNEYERLVATVHELLQMLCVILHTQSMFIVSIIERLARNRLAEHCHFRGRVGSIDIAYDAGRLVLNGRLPSFYLKQLLQTILRDIEDVDQIDNRVDVVSIDGLSSVGPK